MFAESLKLERRTRPTLPQSGRINRSSILAPRPELSLPGNQGGFVFRTRGSIPRANCAVQINCERINAPFGNPTTHCLRERLLSPGRASSTPASSSRGRDCGRNQLAGNAGLFQFTHFIRYDCTIIQNLSCGGRKRACRVQLSDSKLQVYK